MGDLKRRQVSNEQDMTKEVVSALRTCSGAGGMWEQMCCEWDVRHRWVPTGDTASNRATNRCIASIGAIVKAINTGLKHIEADSADRVYRVFDNT